MKFSAIKNLIGAVAPTLGTALGGPLGGAAAQAIAEVLGCNPDAKSLEKAVASATPEQLSEIKKAEIKFQTRMKELEVDIFALETADIQNARSAHSGDWTPRIIALACIMFFGGYIFMVTVQPPEANSEAVINLVLGYLGGIVSAITSFYFGASHKDTSK
jgi:hypothetical protein